MGLWFALAATQPVYYDYGTSVYYQDNQVYYGDNVIATSDEYYTQAEKIAENVPADLDDEKVEWMPLGVFAMNDGDSSSSSRSTTSCEASTSSCWASNWRDSRRISRKIS